MGKALLTVPGHGWARRTIGENMRRKDEKQQESQLLVRIPKDIHLEAKALAAYRNESLQQYVHDALLERIMIDKKYIKPQME